MLIIIIIKGPVFYFSPWSPFLSLNLLCFLPNRVMARSGLRLPPPRLLQVAGHLNVAVFNVRNVLHQQLVVQLHVLRRLSRQLLGYTQPPIRHLLGEDGQGLLKNLIIKASPMSPNQLGGEGIAVHVAPINFISYGENLILILLYTKKESLVLLGDFSRVSWESNTKISNREAEILAVHEKELLFCLWNLPSPTLLIPHVFSFVSFFTTDSLNLHSFQLIYFFKYLF